MQEGNSTGIDKKTRKSESFCPERILIVISGLV